jgi:hypothetical protein
MGRIIPYMKWKIKKMFETTNQKIINNHPKDIRHSSIIINVVNRITWVYPMKLNLYCGWLIGFALW